MFQTSARRIDCEMKTAAGTLVRQTRRSRAAFDTYECSPFLRLIGSSSIHVIEIVVLHTVSTQFARLHLRGDEWKIWVATKEAAWVACNCN